MGVLSKRFGKLSTLAHPSSYHWTGRYHTSPVDGSCFLDSVVVLDWASYTPIPIRSRIHTPLVPSGFSRHREALAKDPLSTTPRAAVDIERC